MDKKNPNMNLSTFGERRNGDTYVKEKIAQATRNQLDASFVIRIDILPKIAPK